MKQVLPRPFRLKLKIPSKAVQQVMRLSPSICLHITVFSEELAYGKQMLFYRCKVLAFFRKKRSLVK